MRMITKMKSVLKSDKDDVHPSVNGIYMLR